MSDPNATPYSSAPEPTPYNAGGAPASNKTNTLAIVSLILAFFVSIGGIIVGHIALGQIKRTGEGGRGLALAGTILGYVFTAGYIILIAIWIIAAVALANSGYSSTDF
jgi:hypothetical protein